MPSYALVVPLPVNRFTNKLAPNNISTRPPFRSFASFLIVLLTLFINKPDYPRDLTIFTISFISSLEIDNVVLPDLNIILWLAASVDDSVAVNPNGIKILLTNGLSTLPMKAIPFLVMVLNSYIKILLIVLFYAIALLIILY